MDIPAELKTIQAQFNDIKKQLLADSKVKIKKLSHPSIKRCNISDNLCKLLGLVQNTRLTRVEIYHRFYIYLIKRNLLNSDQTFKVSDKVRKVLDLDNAPTLGDLKKKLKHPIDDHLTQFIGTDTHLHVVAIIDCLEHNFS